MSRVFQINTGAQIGGLLEAQSGLTVTGTTILGSQATATTHAVRADRTLTAGTGLSGGGNLTANRTISFDTTWGDARYAPLTHVGTGGTSHALVTTTVHGFMSFSDKVKLNAIQENAINQTTTDGRYVQLTRTLTAGNGLTGLGDLSANRTVTLGTPSTITGSTTNSVTADSHTHALTVTKSDVALGSVENYGIATKAEAEAGTSNVKYMTPLRTKEAIDILQAIKSVNGKTGVVTLTNADVDAPPTARTISAGTGLTGGGSLASNRTINFDTTWGDARYSLTTHHHDAQYAPLSHVGSTGNAHGVVTTSVNGFMIAADKAKLDNIQANAINQTTADGRYALQTISMTAGTGLTGGGTLAGNRTFNADFTTSGGENGTDTKVARGNHHHDSRYLNKTGDSSTGNFSLGRQLTLTDGTSGIVSILLDRGTTAHAWRIQNASGIFSLFGGDATASSERLSIDSSGGVQIHETLTVNKTSTITGLLTLGTQATGTTHAVRADRSLTAGNGLSGGGDLTANRTFTLGTPSTITASTTNSVTATSHTHALTVTKTDVALGSVENYGIATKIEAEAGTTNVKYMTPLRTKEAIDVLQAVKSVAGKTGIVTLVASDVGAPPTSRNILTGTGLTGGGNLTADRTLAVDFTEVATAGHNHDTVYALRSLTLTAGTGITGGGNLTANRTFNFDTTWGDARYALSGHGHSDLTPTSRSISTGWGIDGGGNLTANRTFTVSQTDLDGRYQRTGVNSNLPNIKRATLTISSGQTEVTWTHNYGSTAYSATATPNSVARHVAWRNKTVNAITFYLDSPHIEAISLDVTFIGS